MSISAPSGRIVIAGTLTRSSAVDRLRRFGAALRRMGPLPVAGAIVIIAVVFCAIFAPLIAPHAPNAADPPHRLLPVGSAGHLFGTDALGRDILSRLIWGCQPTLIAGLVPVAVGGILGTAIGVTAGLGPRWLNGVIMRLLDVLYAFPAVLLAIAISSALGPGLINAIISLSVVLTPSVARMSEAEVRRMRGADYMLAARTNGAGMPRIAVVQVLPVVAPPLIVYLMAAVGLAVVYAAGLSFLGLGVVPPRAEWGVMVNDLQQQLFTAPELLLAPALAIFLLSVSFNLLGDGMQRILNVRLGEV